MLLGDRDPGPAELADLGPERVVVGLSASASSRTFSGLKRLARNSRAVALISRCSSLKSKSIALLATEPRAGRAPARRRCSSSRRWCRPRSSWRASAGTGRPTASPRASASAPPTSTASSVSAWLSRRPLPLGDRALGPGDADLHRRGQRPHARRAAAPSIPIFSSAIRSRISGSSARPRSLASSISSSRSSARPSAADGAEAGALVHQRRDRDHPAVALAADDVLVGDVGVLDEELVELGLAGDLAQRPDLDLVLLHVQRK